MALIVGCGVGGGTWYALNRYTAKYTSEAQFAVQANRIDMNNAGLTDDSLVRMTELEPLILSEVNRIVSEPTLRQILNKPAVQNTKWFQQFGNNLDDAFEALDEEVIGSRHIRNTQLFVVRATTKDKLDSQTILEALNAEYLRQKSEEVSNTNARALLAAQNRRDNAEEAIAKETVRITRFQQNDPLDTLVQGQSQADIRVRALIVQQEELTQAFNSVQAIYELLDQRQQENNFDPSDEERAQIEASQEFLSIDSQIRQLRVQREDLLRKYKENHETIQSIDRQMLALKREREEEFETQSLVLFNAKLEQATNGVAQLSSELQKTNTTLTEWTKRREDFVRKLTEYQAIQRALVQAENDRDEATNTIEALTVIQENDSRVTVRESVPPQQAQKSFPPEPYVMIPGIGLLIMGLVTGLIFLRELLDQRVRSAQDVKMIPDATLVGMIPSASQDRDAKRVERVVEHHPSGLLAEAFRQARTAVLSKIDRRGYKTLMMVSAKPNSGVTTSAQNLAASCARSGRRVLLIDANFRRPALANLMAVSGQPGLAEALSGDQPIDEARGLVQPTDVDGMFLLPAGDTRNAAVELFESPRFRDLMGKLEAEYDLLIIDAPPALLTSDAQLLTRHVDAMVLVSRAQSDTRGMLQRLYRELDGQRADILGVLLNGVEASVGGYLKRNFREFHEYSGPERRKSARTTSSNGASHKQPPAPIAIDEVTADQDVFGEMDLDDQEDQDR